MIYKIYIQKNQINTLKTLNISPIKELSCGWKLTDMFFVDRMNKVR